MTIATRDSVDTPYQPRPLNFLLEYKKPGNIWWRLIKRLIQHIPEKNFRMIRYFGFLANRVVGNKLSKVRNALGMERNPTMTPPLRYGQMMKSFLRVDRKTSLMRL
ncbi:transposase [Vibrio lentus]